MNPLRHRKPASLPGRRTLIAGWLLMTLASSAMAQALPTAKVWKDPACGCCQHWVSHLKKAGFEVQVFDTGNTSARRLLGMPQQYASCHTAQIGGYTIEGHVPAEDIKRLLRDKPKAIGLAVPGMPIGSPGMDGPAYGGRRDRYDVLLVGTNGQPTVHQSHR